MWLIKSNIYLIESIKYPNPSGLTPTSVFFGEKRCVDHSEGKGLFAGLALQSSARSRRGRRLVD
ncbi:hypothetical Protein YC6258_02790 [Gynuella sunshinyii YC6258]|uniref:Uncharacterized protein n=1 Tax=Gynuella sunshinyii YC6258 TaxID=1445510 RepID=A0A0C5VN94_9GAMM|nr:hypothetical Protein YC6258_02790 [Gynuella sunshinyii YC6258]